MPSSENLARTVVKEAFYAAINVFSAGRGERIRLNGNQYRIDPRYRAGFTNPYEPAIASYISQRVRRGDVCFDIGANVGIYVLQFATWSGPNGRVVAFEPNPNSFHGLQAQMALNGLTSRVSAIQAAVSDSPGSARMYCSGFNGRSRLVSRSEHCESDNFEIDVMLVTIDEIAERFRVIPNVLLLDVEGFEFRALKGAGRILQQARGRLQLFVEMHPEMWDGAGTPAAEVRSWLQDNGLDVVRIEPEKDPFREGGVVHLTWR
jgi:FkbM family methyltransferase